MGLILQRIYNANSNYMQASFVYYAAKHTTDGYGFYSAVHKVSLKAVQPCAAAVIAVQNIPHPK